MTATVRPTLPKAQYAWDCPICKVGAMPYDFPETAAIAAKAHDDEKHPSAPEESSGAR